MDELCGWCAPTSQCVAKKPQFSLVGTDPLCPEPLWTTALSAKAEAAGELVDGPSFSLWTGKQWKRHQNSGKCDVVVTRTRLVILPVGGNSKMYFHFITETLRELWPYAKRYPEDLAQLNFLIVLGKKADETHSAFFGLFSDRCWRRAADVPLNTCVFDSPDVKPLLVSQQDLSSEPPPTMAFPEPPRRTAIPAGALVNVQALDLFEYIPLSLGLRDVAITKPLVTIISRRNKRLLLNQEQLLDVCRDVGVDAVLVSFETMTLYEQMELLSRTTVLVGMHGSGLTNSLFLQPNTAMLQLVPYQVAGARRFFDRNPHVRYFEWINTHRENAVFHWHFVPEYDTKSRRDRMLARGSSCCGEGTYFAFWINQDTIVDAGEFRAKLVEMLEFTNKVIAQPTEDLV